MFQEHWPNWSFSLQGEKDEMICLNYCLIHNCLYLGGQWRTSFNEEQRPTHFSWWHKFRERLHSSGDDGTLPFEPMPFCTLKKSLPGSPIFHFREGVLLQNLAGGPDAGCGNLQVTNNFFKIYNLQQRYFFKEMGSTLIAPWQGATPGPGWLSSRRRQGGGSRRKRGRERGERIRRGRKRKLRNLSRISRMYDLPTYRCLNSPLSL